MAGQKIVPHLWFDDLAGADVHGQPEGKVITVDFALGGYWTVGLNGGPHFRPTAAVSYFVTFEDAGALDRAWAALLDGGEVAMPLDAYKWSPRYGWVTDRWGVNWQLSASRLADVGGQPVVPCLLFTGAERVAAAFMEVGNLDLAALERACNG